MFKTFIVLFSLCFHFVPLPPGGFDFKDKTLQKELRKVSGVENEVWKEIQVPEAILTANPFQGKFLVHTDHQRYIYAGRVNSCRQGGCSNPVETLTIETPEYFDYLIVFDAGLSVQLVKVYNYQATHGQEVSNKGWLKQFQGYDGSRSLTVGKSIDGISGATVSVYGITTDIQEKTRLLRQITAQK